MKQDQLKVKYLMIKHQKEKNNYKSLIFRQAK